MNGPVTYHAVTGSGRTWLDARDRYDELTQRHHLARTTATLKARGEYDPARHGTAEHAPLTLAEHLEVLANGEVVARVYRHPAKCTAPCKLGRPGSRLLRRPGPAKRRRGRPTGSSPRASTASARL